MIKELSLAVIFGLLIGFGLTGTFYFLQQKDRQIKNTPNIIIPTPNLEENNQSSLTPTTTDIQTNNSPLNIISPQDNDIINTSKTIIKGQSSPNSFIIITTPVKNYHLYTDTQGNFSQNVDLEAGLNAINITAINKFDQENHLEMFLTYSTTKLE